MAKVGQTLLPGSKIKTEAGASCTVAFTDQSKVRIGPKATFKLEEVVPSKIAVFIGLGKLEAWVKKGLKRTFQARNPVSVASVRGTVFAVNVLSPTSVTVDVFEGELAVQDNFGNTTSVGQGKRVEADAVTGASAPAPVPASVSAPVEPTVTIAPPPNPAAPAEPSPTTTTAPPPADTVPTTETTETTLEAPPPPNPAQETTTVVSPSSP
ncbi:MAG: FecR family protein [Elusimicrobia bacterium]|nr:FecR family protein [Elusimicrobiota bacterium]